MEEGVDADSGGGKVNGIERNSIGVIINEGLRLPTTTFFTSMGNGGGDGGDGGGGGGRGGGVN